jgi:hypothetical protein
VARHPKQQESLVPRIAALVVLCLLCSCKASVEPAAKKAPNLESPNGVAPLNFPPPLLYPSSPSAPLD